MTAALFIGKRSFAPCSTSPSMHPPPTVPIELFPSLVTIILERALAGVEPEVEMIVASMTRCSEERVERREETMSMTGVLRLWIQACYVRPSEFPDHSAVTSLPHCG